MEYWNTGRLGTWKTGRVASSTIPPLHHSIIPARKAGLTLIEVMLAIVILSIGAGTLMLAIARCISVIGKSHHYSNARRLIQEVNTLEPLTRGEIEEGTATGDFDDADGYTWAREILQADEENRPGLYTVRTRVIWSARGREGHEEMVSYFYVQPEETSR